MSNIHPSCSTLFICSAILCWNHQDFTYSFFNFTHCTPNSFYLSSNIHLIFHNNKFSKIKEKFNKNDFICSYCKRKDFQLHFISQCQQQRIRIQMKNYCHYIKSKSYCQCYASEKANEFITNWTRALVQPGKSTINVKRFLHIHQSTSLMVFLFMGLIGFLIFFGGIISMIFYSMKLKSSIVK